MDGGENAVLARVPPARFDARDTFVGSQCAWLPYTGHSGHDTGHLGTWYKEHDTQSLLTEQGTHDTQYKNRANIIKTKKYGKHNTHLMKYSKHDTPYKKYGAQSMCLITRVARARSMELPSQLILGSIFIFLFWF